MPLLFAAHNSGPVRGTLNLRLVCPVAPIVNDDTAAYLRSRASQCRSFARWHAGSAAEYLTMLAEDFEAKANELDADLMPVHRQTTRRGQAHDS